MHQFHPVMLLMTAWLPGSCSAPAPACALPPRGVFPSRADVILRDFRGIELPHVDAVTIRRSGAIAFNDKPASFEQVEAYITTGAQFTPQPYITVDFERGADCATISRVRRSIDRSYDCANNNRCLQGPPPEWMTR